MLEASTERRDANGDSSPRRSGRTTAIANLSGSQAMNTAGRLVVLLAGIGFLISSYFTAVAYGWVRPDAPWVPRFCRMDPQTCTSVVFTPQARLLGLPNSVLGQVYYVGLVAAVASERIFSGPVFWLALAVSLGTVALAAYLWYALLFVIRVRCRACFLAHAINIAIACILLVEWRARYH